MKNSHVPSTKRSIVLPLRVISEANRSRKEHWGTGTQRKNQQKNQAYVGTLSIIPPGWTAQGKAVTVTLTRIAPRTLDSDNLARALKAVRDGVAKAMKVDDKDSLQLSWICHQERGGVNQYAVRIEIGMK